jgi:hypothetical protein
MNGPSAPAPDEARIKLANRLLDALQFDSTLDRFGTPGSSASETDTAARKTLGDFRKKNLDVVRMRRHAAEAYAALFTEAELIELTRVFESPAGRKYIEVQPKIAAAISQVVAAAFTEHLEEFKRDVLGMP